MLATRKIRHGINAVYPYLLFRRQKVQVFRYHGSDCKFFSTLVDSNGQTDAYTVQNDDIRPLQSFPTTAGTILVQARDPAKLSAQILTAAENRRYDESWKLFEQHMQMEGFPRKSVVNTLLVYFAQSMDVNWLQKAFGIVEQAFEESKQNLLETETLVYLALGLASRNLPVPASTILRKLIATEQYPPVAAWSTVLAHMCYSGPGAYLAAELILEIGYIFQNNRVDPRKKSNAPLIAMKPNATALNIALTGCLLFGTTRKAEELLEMVPKIGVKTDAKLFIIMAHIYERNGRRDELKKLQRHINEALNLTDVQFQQFYDCLLSCHLKFGDLDSASNMVLKMISKANEAKNSLAVATFGFDARKYENKSASGQILTDCDSALEFSIMPYDKFLEDKRFSNLESLTKNILEELLSKLQAQVKLITTDRGILQPTEKIYVKLVKAYLEADKTKSLAEFLINAEREDSPLSNDDSALTNVINACISLGWLDQAHDLLDEIRFAGVRTGSSVYASLLKAYCKENRTPEITSLLREAQKSGIQLDSSCYDALIKSRVLENDTPGALNLFKEMKEARLSRGVPHKFEELVKGCAENKEAGLMAKLLREIKEEQNINCAVHDWNNVIHFFSKKRLMQDAEKALKKMTSLGINPNAQTFHSMVTGYAAIGGKYIEVTELWGEMKSLARSTSMKFDLELLDSVLYTFVRGGFFHRANEVVEMLEKGNMFVDKYKYRMLYLKYHKQLYRGKAPQFQTEAQLKKREATLAFKKWISLI
ncbi:hypothetical protein ACFE04_015692 [Oxalis oulophora]